MRKKKEVSCTIPFARTRKGFKMKKIGVLYRGGSLSELREIFELA
ncbi:MAG: hypothetical protein WD824_07280 [Cyclobacteriaceae bacterium]